MGRISGHLQAAGLAIGFLERVVVRNTAPSNPRPITRSRPFVQPGKNLSRHQRQILLGLDFLDVDRRLGA
jgi:hypothetical protein